MAIWFSFSFIASYILFMGLTGLRREYSNYCSNVNQYPGTHVQGLTLRINTLVHVLEALGLAMFSGKHHQNPIKTHKTVSSLSAINSIPHMFPILELAITFVTSLNSSKAG